MTPAEVLDGLRQRGARMELTPDGRLRISPAGLLTPEERASLRAHGQDVMNLLRSPAPPPADLHGLLATETKAEWDRIDAWARELGGLHLTRDLCRWLRESAPDLWQRLRLAEGEMDAATLSGDQAALRSALSRWSLRWCAARRAFEDAVGLEPGEGRS